MAEPYRIKVHNLETCNCNHGCGCQFGGFPDHGPCEALLGYDVIEGHYGDVDLAGARVVIAVKWPGAIHDGGGEAAVFVDESITDEQEQGLAMIFSGQAGGMPWEAIGGTIASLQGPLRRPIEMNVDGPKSSFSIAGVLDANMSPLKDPVSGDEKDVHIVYPSGGFIWDDGRIGTTQDMRVDFGGIQFDHRGMFAAYATPEWTNQA